MLQASTATPRNRIVLKDGPVHQGQAPEHFRRRARRWYRRLAWYFHPNYT
jgi:hypothetical protein